MSDVALTFIILAVVIALFIWNRFPAPLVAIGAAIAFYLAGVIDLQQAVGGFGQPVVILIATLFVIGAGLEASGVVAWAGQLLIARAGSSRVRLFLLIFALVTAFSASIGVNGATAALIPLVIIVAVRTRMAPSKILIPMMFVGHAAAMLTLLGTPVNPVMTNFWETAGLGTFGFFEFALVGIPLVLGTAAIVLFLGDKLLPEHRGAALPTDLSQHAQTLVEQYRLEDGMHRLRVRKTSPYVGMQRSATTLEEYEGLALTAVQDGGTGAPLQRPVIAEGDIMLVRGDAAGVARLAAEKHLAIREEGDDSGDVAGSLFNRASGLAEIVIPARSKLIGTAVFPGMTARNGDLIVLGMQRGGEDLGAQPVALEAGDHLLLQGTWQALDKHLADPQVLVVDSPEVVRKQALALGPGARSAIVILGALIILLATEVVSPAIAGLLCASAMVLTGVLSLPQAFKKIDWNTCTLLGGVFAVAAAMTSSGAAALIADKLVETLGPAGPFALLAGMVVISAVLTQFIANVAAGMVVWPVAIAAAADMGVSPAPFLMAIAIAASSAFLTPIGSPPNLMVFGPGGYKFGDYWKLGLLVLLWFLAVAVFLVPLIWRF